MKVLAYQIGKDGLIKVEVFANAAQDDLRSRISQVNAELRKAVHMYDLDSTSLDLIEHRQIGNHRFEGGGFISITKRNLDV